MALVYWLQLEMLRQGKTMKDRKGNKRKEQALPMPSFWVGLVSPVYNTTKNFETEL